MNDSRSAGSRKLIILIICLGNLIFWLIPSDVLDLVAREQQVLCGRYSRTQFSWMLGVALLSALAIFLLTAASRPVLRRRIFALGAIAIGLIPVAAIADIAVRLRTEYPYQVDAVVYHRPPNRKYHEPYRDEPVAKRSYPTHQPGYGVVDCTMIYDAAGFRNANVPTTCDILAIGDSFTEGSRVSDDQPWPVLLSRLTGKSVYNLGISGYNPAEYLAALTAYGLQHKPGCVICMLYEGNDFRTGEVEAKSGVSARQFIRTSPLLLYTNDLMVRLLGPIGADWHNDKLDAISWMPIEYPKGAAGRYYAFSPKQLTELNVKPAEFATSEEWFAVKSVLRRMNDACQSAGAKFVIAYAPNKAHVVFPLAAPGLPSDKVAAFASIRAKTPAPANFVEQLTANLESREAVISEYCTERSIPFASTTAALREYVRASKQPYYTYDQHWSPLGHEAAAGAIAASVAKSGS